MANENFPKTIGPFPDQVTYLANGSKQVEGDFYIREGVSDQEAREDLAQKVGIDPDQVILGGANRRKGRNKSSASFGNWNSSWVPGGVDPTEIDASQN